MHKERETATNDAREVRDGRPPNGLNRKDRRALGKIDRQVADIDRQIEKLEKEGKPDAR
jgi:hypothetical protein